MKPKPPNSDMEKYVIDQYHRERSGSVLKGRIDELEKRVAHLETLLLEMKRDAPRD